MENPLISVIVPIYNVENFLDECIKSIANQSYKNLEIILVDDGSTDNSSQICDAWKQTDDRVRVIHKENGGSSSSRNEGLNIAKGDYIGFVDSDDYISEFMFEELLNGLIKSDSKISYCNIYRVSANGSSWLMNPVTNEKKLNVYQTIDGIFYGDIDTSVCTKLFEKSLFEEIRFPEGETNEEFSILLPIIDKAGGLYYTGKGLYYYRIRSGSVTNVSYMDEKHSDVVYKNLNLIHKQMLNLNLPCEKSFSHFSVMCAYSRTLAMEKKYTLLSDKVKKDYNIYKKIMYKHFFVFMFSKRIKIKDKILYFMVVTKILRPLYKIFYKNHL